MRENVINCIQYIILLYSSIILYSNCSSFHKYYRFSMQLSNGLSNGLTKDNYYTNSIISNKLFYHHLHDLADISNHCDESTQYLYKSLQYNNFRQNISIIQRTLDDIDIQYNIIEYYNTNLQEYRHVISIRGTKTLKNFQADIDNRLEFDDFLGISCHRGFRLIYRRILDDLLDAKNPAYNNLLKKHLRSSKLLSNFSFDSVKLYLTGHSLGNTFVLNIWFESIIIFLIGGSVSILLAGALQRLYNCRIQGVVVFGVPKFTNTKGSQDLSHLPVISVENVLDPIVKAPFTIPFGPRYDSLLPKHHIIIEPMKSNHTGKYEYRFNHPETIKLSKTMSTKLHWHFMGNYHRAISSYLLNSLK